MRELRYSVRRRVLRLRSRGATYRALICGVTALSVLVTAASLIPTPRLIWNASASAPIGFYWRIAGAPSRGDLVLARTPLWARKLAAGRGYLPMNVPILKRVAAVAGEVICAWGDAISIDGLVVAFRHASDGMDRPLPQWQGCETLGADEFFLLVADAPDSFDGRYFGVSKRGDIIGRLVPLWIK